VWNAHGLEHVPGSTGPFIGVNDVGEMDPWDRFILTAKNEHTAILSYHSSMFMGSKKPIVPLVPPFLKASSPGLGLEAIACNQLLSRS
jgi:hypothetical protein